MSHNPHANAFPVGGRPWTDDETLVLRTMVNEGRTYAEIATSLDRSYVAVKCRVRWISISPEMRAEASRIKKVARQIKTAPKTRDDVRAEKWSIPADVAANRNLRMAASKSLTAILMGDPAPSQSALDRRA